MSGDWESVPFWESLSFPWLAFLGWFLAFRLVRVLAAASEASAFARSAGLLSSVLASSLELAVRALPLVVVWFVLSGRFAVCLPLGSRFWLCLDAVSVGSWFPRRPLVGRPGWGLRVGCGRSCGELFEGGRQCAGQRCREGWVLPEAVVPSAWTPGLRERSAGLAGCLGARRRPRHWRKACWGGFRPRRMQKCSRMSSGCRDLNPGELP